MSSNNKNSIILIWREPVSRRDFQIGELSRNNRYEFEYKFERLEAKRNGFFNLLSFPEDSGKYVSEKLFPVFLSRLPDKKRRDINKILEKYGMTEYDDFELLKRGKAQLPIDNLRFADPNAL